MKNQLKNLKQTPMLLLVCAGLALCLAACAGPSGSDNVSRPAQPEASDPAPADTPERIAYVTQGVSFHVPTDWTQAEGTDLFYTTDQNQVYGLNGASALGAYSAQDFYEDLVDYYETSGQFDRLDAPESLKEWQSGDGVACQTANLTGYQGSILYCTKLVIAPQKNLVLTFCAQAHKDAGQDPDDIWNELNDLCASLAFQTGNEDYISGNTFLCGDGSQLCLADDGNFRYYQSADDHENQYYEGVYHVYYGQAAVDKVASMTEYGLSGKELEQVLSTSMNGYIPGGSKPSDYLYSTGELEDNRTRYAVCLDTFYAVILDNQRLVHSSEDVTEGGNSVLYLGFYLPELELADLTNVNAASHTQWTLQGKTG